MLLRLLLRGERGKRRGDTPPPRLVLTPLPLDDAAGRADEEEEEDACVDAPAAAAAMRIALASGDMAAEEAFLALLKPELEVEEDEA